MQNQNKTSKLLNAKNKIKIKIYFLKTTPPTLSSKTNTWQERGKVHHLN
jgi:hypothetical protein